MKIEEIILNIENCKKCAEMVGIPVHGCVAKTKIIAIGQAPGVHEEQFAKPFAYTAGKKLFQWFESIGLVEEEFRKKINLSAVCRCFPGKAKSGDRKPSRDEVENCRPHLEAEIRFHKPSLIIPIGKLAIEQFLEELSGCNYIMEDGNVFSKKYKLNDVIGRSFRLMKYGVDFDLIPLSHPSGLNAWNNRPSGKEKIKQALNLIREHSAFQEVLKN